MIRHRETVPIHDEKGFEGMRKAGALAAKVLDYLTPFVEPGVTTAKLDELCHNYIIEHGAVPATLNYRGYPKSCCISINEVVCHGIPSKKVKLSRGDILNIDVTVILDGWFGDTSRMYVAGDWDSLSAKKRKLINVTYDCLMLGIEAVAPGKTLGDIGHAIASHAHANGFSVVEDFCGHGLGQVFHAPPSVIHTGRPGEGQVLMPGMFFTIEPMINIGVKDTWTDPKDGWTARTTDGKPSAQFEHSLAVTETGYEIFTNSPEGLTKPPYAKG